MTTFKKLGVAKFIEPTILKALDLQLPKIEKNVPLTGPYRTSERAKKWRYFIEQMKIGDSFFIPHEDDQSCANNAVLWARKQGHRFSKRNFENGIRVWRVA